MMAKNVYVTIVSVHGAQLQNAYMNNVPRVGDVPVHGQHLGILLIELGVGTTVAAVMISVFYAFGETVRTDE